VILLASALAAAKVPEVCLAAEAPEPGRTISVAWVSPLRRRAGSHRFLDVVPTAELRRVATSDGSVARMLQRLGMRKSTREPDRRYKVVVFDARTDDLYGCGATIDRGAGGGKGLPLYGATWATLAADGFCVLPATRFVAGDDK
jgi:hypothetical protein